MHVQCPCPLFWPFNTWFSLFTPTNNKRPQLLFPCLFEMSHASICACVCISLSMHVCADYFSFAYDCPSVCVSVCVICTAENSRNIAPVTCCIILGAKGDSPGWFISMERCLPVFEEAKIEQYKACQGKKRERKNQYSRHTLYTVQPGKSC